MERRHGARRLGGLLAIAVTVALSAGCDLGSEAGSSPTTVVESGDAARNGNGQGNGQGNGNGGRGHNCPNPAGNRPPGQCRPASG